MIAAGSVGNLGAGRPAGMSAKGSCVATCDQPLPADAGIICRLLCTSEHQFRSTIILRKKSQEPEIRSPGALSSFPPPQVAIIHAVGTWVQGPPGLNANSLQFCQPVRLSSEQRLNILQEPAQARSGLSHHGHLHQRWFGQQRQPPAPGRTHIFRARQDLAIWKRRKHSNWPVCRYPFLRLRKSWSI